MNSRTILITLLGLIAFLAIQTSAQLTPLTCPKRTCAKVLEECGTLNLTVGIQTQVGCKGEATCATNGGIRGICVAPYALGEPCDSGQCESGTTCDDGFCTLNSPAINFLLPGEGCKHDIQCRYNPFTSGDDDINLCNSGKCKKVKNGEYCSSSNQCDGNKAYCSRSGRCEKNIGKGGICNRGDDSGNGCGRRSACVPTSSDGNAGTCQPDYSLGEGKFCTSDRQCKEELFCGTARSGESYGVCTKPAKTLTRDLPCISNLLCNATNRETCRCTEKSTNSICVVDTAPKGWKNAEWNFNECARKKCGNTGYNTCLYDKCRNQACKVYELRRKTGSTSFSCQYESYCNSAFLLSFSPIVVLSAFVALFLF